MEEVLESHKVVLLSDGLRILEKQCEDEGKEEITVMLSLICKSLDYIFPYIDLAVSTNR